MTEKKPKTYVCCGSSLFHTTDCELVHPGRKSALDTPLPPGVDLCLYRGTDSGILLKALNFGGKERPPDWRTAAALSREQAHALGVRLIMLAENLKG